MVTPATLVDAQVPLEWRDKVEPVRGKGCERCGGTGYRGRIGMFEVMPMTESLRDLVARGGNADELRRAAIDQGMLTLRQSGLLKFIQGVTTLDEVVFNSRPDGGVLE